MEENMIFRKEWFEAEMKNQFYKTTPQEMAYIEYAASMYCFYGEIIDIGAVFGSDFSGLNRTFGQLIPQIDKILIARQKGADNAKKGNQNCGKQSFDSEAIYNLIMEGKNVTEVIEILGYDKDKKRSIYSNKGYKKALVDLKRATEPEVKSKNEIKNGGAFNF